MLRNCLLAFCVLYLGVHVLPADANEVGHVKVVKGAASVQRGAEKIAITPAMKIFAADVIITGADGAVGITFTDNSLISTGPNSVLSIDQYSFDRTTHAGQFNSTLKKGTLAAISGKMVKQAPESMRIHTPASIMGVRGTEFVVKVDDVDATR
jgi:hypothetical protein